MYDSKSQSGMYHRHRFGRTFSVNSIKTPRLRQESFAIPLCFINFLNSPWQASSRLRGTRTLFVSAFGPLNFQAQTD